MKAIHLPDLNRHYWIALIIASIFGANTGDYFSDVLGLGHISGLPFLALSFAIILIAERFDKLQHPSYYWAAIIVARTSATNIGDVFHDFHISFLISIPSVAAVLLVVLLCWKLKNKTEFLNTTPSAAPLMNNGFYWVAMLTAGVLGTVVGDYFSYPLQLGNLNAAIILSLPLAAALMFGRNGKLNHLFYFWFTVVLIRSAGTAAGDYVAHEVFGLPISTAVSGVIFVAFLFYVNRNNKRVSTD